MQAVQSTAPLVDFFARVLTGEERIESEREGRYLEVASKETDDYRLSAERSRAESDRAVKVDRSTGRTLTARKGAALWLHDRLIEWSGVE